MKSDVKYSQEYLSFYQEVKSSFDKYHNSFRKKIDLFWASDSRKNQIFLMELADKTLLEQKRSFHYIFAAYYYYVASRKGSIKGTLQAHGKLITLLNTPEVSNYFVKKGFVVEDGKKATALIREMMYEYYPVQAGNEFSSFLGFIAEYYGKNFKKTNTHPVIYKSYASELLHEISHYNDSDYWTNKAHNWVFHHSETPYEEAYYAYENWVTGGDATYFYKMCWNEEVKQAHFEKLSGRESNRSKMRASNNGSHKQSGQENETRYSLVFNFARHHFDAALTAMLKMIDGMEKGN